MNRLHRPRPLNDVATKTALRCCLTLNSDNPTAHANAADASVPCPSRPYAAVCPLAIATIFVSDAAASSVIAVIYRECASSVTA